MPASLFHTLNISRQDLLTRMRDLDVTSNNLANVNTAGYKTTRSNFQEVLEKQLKEGDQLSATQMLNAQGSLKDSQNGLDWAIQGEGFFSVTLPDGSLGYTRDGQFTLDTNRNIVSASGYPLVWTGNVPAGTTNITVSAAGDVSGLDAKGASVQLGTLQLTRFPNSSGLTSHGDNIWLESDASGAAITGAPGSENFGTTNSFRIEQSNVEMSQELTHLITLQRSFSMSLKAFEQTDMMISLAINLRKA